MDNNTQLGKTKKKSRHPAKKLKFGEFFDARNTQVSPPSQGVQGIVIDKDPGKSRTAGFPKGTKPGDGGLAEQSLMQELIEIASTPQPAYMPGTAETPRNNGLGKPAQESNDEELGDGESYPTARENDPNMGLDDPDVDTESLVDPNRAGVLRTVKGAHLVYKRESEEGKYDELWVFPLGTSIDEVTLRKTVLAGTDIPPGQVSSEDGSQTYSIWTAGNAQLIHIEGLPQ